MEQTGASRAEYGKHVIEVASAALTEVFGKGFSYTNIANYKRFYLTFNNPIQQTLPDELSSHFQKGQTLFDLFEYHFLYNYPFIYKTITFSCIRFAISDIYAYLCRC